MTSNTLAVGTTDLITRKLWSAAALGCVLLQGLVLRRRGRLRSQASQNSQIAAARKAWRIFVAVMREIFDENAYLRFLQRTNARRSVASYGEFVREREVTAARRTRCC